MLLAPSILSADFINLQRDVHTLEMAGADLLHIDVMDGHFVPNLAFGPQVVAALRPQTKLPLDVHLMVEHPENFVEMFAKAGADTLLAHVESTPHIYHTLELIQAHNMKPGVVLNPGTPISAIEAVLPIVKQVLIMTVNPGFGGQSFLKPMLKKIAHLDQIRQTEPNTDFKIEVDGGINDQTIKATAEAGADIFVSGSYLFKANTPQIQLQHLRELVE